MQNHQREIDIAESNRLIEVQNSENTLNYKHNKRRAYIKFLITLISSILGLIIFIITFKYCNNNISLFIVAFLSIYTALMCFAVCIHSTLYIILNYCY
jgi:VIT1/CCC1 family predicted Fe2+/Mn2+ transporter